MKKHLITALFCFFCLISCQEVGPYRAIEISIINVDYADIKLYQLPDRKLIRQVDFDREYEEITYIRGVPDGVYYLQVISDLLYYDTSIVYKNSIKLLIDLH